MKPFKHLSRWDAWFLVFVVVNAVIAAVVDGVLHDWDEASLNVAVGVFAYLTASYRNDAVGLKKQLRLALERQP